MDTPHFLYFFFYSGANYMFLLEVDQLRLTSMWLTTLGLTTGNR